MAGLTTHVLDTANGVPAKGVKVTLKRDGLPVAKGKTNADGRLKQPLLEAPMPVGRYILHFEAGDYFRKLGTELPDPPFVDEVKIAFGIADPDAHYHVPLLVSPWSYSTYRGS